MPGRLRDIEACEQRLINLWPAVETLMVGPWAVRFAHGYAGRTNSASALFAGAGLSDADIDWIIARYRAVGLPPAIRVTPLAEAGLAGRLEAKGWVVRTHSLGMVAERQAEWAYDARVAISPVPGRAWLDGVSALQEESKRNPAHLEAIVSRIRLPVGFATVLRDGAPVGFGMVAVDRGYAEIGSIILAPQARGQGLGRALVISMLRFAVESGAERAFLQVEAKNAVARALYTALGFAPLYDYHEYRLPA